MPAPDVVPYGTTSTGHPVRRITLRNARGMALTLLDYGATIAELLVPDRYDRPGNVVLGCPTLADYETKSPYFGAVIGRFANRIADASFALDGHVFSLPANEGPNTIHGGPATGPTPNFSHRVWDIVTASDASATLRLESPDGENGFPGDLTVDVTYTVEDANALRIDYEASVARRPTVLNLTNHTYFNLAGTGTALDHLVTIASSRYLPTDSARIPTGALAPVAGTPMDFCAAHPPGERIAADFAPLRTAGGYDHCYVLNKPESTLGAAATLHDPASGRILTVETTEPGVQLYTGNALGPAIPHRNGQPCHPGDGIALETQHFPDSPNRPSFPSTRLDPSQTFRSTTIWRFGIDRPGS